MREEIGVFADRAVLEYCGVRESFAALSLNLKGNIRLFSHDLTAPPAASQIA